MDAYERLTMAIERIRTKGLAVGMIREGSLDGPGCLIGSLSRDEELAAELGHVVPSSSSSRQEIEEALSLCGFEGSVGLLHAAALWNDHVARGNPDMAIALLELGRDQFLHQQADMVEVQQPVAYIKEEAYAKV